MGILKKIRPPKNHMTLNREKKIWAYDTHLKMTAIGIHFGTENLKKSLVQILRNFDFLIFDPCLRGHLYGNP